MRYFILSIALLLAPGISNTLNAQVHLNVNINMGSQPDWGPTGYDYVEYYYLPDIDVFYSVPQHCYYYYGGGHWIHSSHLPSRFHDYDPYHSYKVVVNEREPWRHHEIYREKYSSYRGRHDQHLIRDSRDSRYFEHRATEQRHDNGKHNGRGRGNKGRK